MAGPDTQLWLSSDPPDAEPAALDAVAAELATALDETHDDSPGAAAPLLRNAVAAATATGASLVLSAEPALPVHDALAAEAGLVPVRELLQLRRPLPLPSTTVEPPPTGLRPFDAGRDEAAWLDLNNRAFAWHPEQSGWTPDQLAAKRAEPWYRPDGFLVVEQDGSLVAFCWTKEHRDVSPSLGEIFVVAVDPDHGGRGLGRAVTVAGLTHLADRGLDTAMLYVEADNIPARRLYDDLGFTIHHARRWYRS